MLQKIDKSDGEGPETADSITASSPEKRPRGRPKGSRNKLALESRQVLSKHGPAVMERICRVALGKPVYVAPDEGGRRTKRYPSEAAEMAAQKIVADRLLPSLKAVESVVDQTVRNEGEPADSRQTARAILQVLASAVPEGGKVEVSQPGERIVKFHDGALADKLFPAGGAHTPAGEGESADEASASSSPAAPLPAEPEGQIGDTEDISAGTYIQCVRTREGLQWTAVVGGTMRGEYPTKDEARTMAKQMTGHARIDGGFPDERPWPRKQPRVVLGHQSAKGHYRNG